MNLKRHILFVSLFLISWIGFSQKLYIAENGAMQIQRSDLDGTNFAPVTLPGDVGSIEDIVIDEARNFAFWIQNDATNTIVKRAVISPISGGIQFAPPVDFIRVPLSNKFEALALDKIARELFVTVSASGPAAIYKFSLDATPTIIALPAPVISSLFQVFGIDVDLINSKMYFVNQATTRQIQIANLNGSSPSVIVNISGTFGTIHDVAVDPVGGKIYFSTNNTVGQIYKADLDGSNPLLIVDNLPTTIKGLAIDPKNGFIYWATGSTTVGRAALDGSGATEILTGLTTTNYITVDLSTTIPPKLYWTEGGIQEIHRINPDGSDFERYYFGSSPYPTGIAIDRNARYVYWADRNRSTIKRGLIGETDFESWEEVLNYTDMPPGISGIDLDPNNTMIYFADAGNNKIQRADYSAPFPITGTDVEIVNNPFGLELDLLNGKVYYTANDLGTPNTGTLYRANLDGSGAPEVLISQTVPGPERFMHDVKVDPISGTVYWAFTEADGFATIYKADISNVSGTVTSLVATTSGEVRGIEIDPSTNKLWWVCRGITSFTPPAIMQANLSDGSGVIPLSTASFFPPNGNFIALDGGPASPLLLTSTTPSSNRNNIPKSSDITLVFDQPVLTVNSTNIVFSGSQTGLIVGSISGAGTPTITFNPTNDFKSGEKITVTVTNKVIGTGGEVAVPTIFQFNAASGVGPGTFSSEKIITTNADGANSIFAVDVDGDGDMDIVSSSSVDDKIAWHENDGSQNFTERIISVLANDPRSVYAADVDGDGDMDVLSGSIGDQKVAWYENDGSQNFTERIVDINAAVFITNILAIDLDRDGDMDVVSSSTTNGVAWYENDGTETFTYRIIDNSIDLRGPIYATDLDNDGDMDLVTSSSLNDIVAWHENDGSQIFTQRIISSSAQQPISVFANDIDDDGDVDILSAAFNFSRIYFWKNDDSQNFAQNTITTTLLNARSVYAADMDGDGDIDVLGSSQTDNEVVWYDNDGNEVFAENIISTTALAVQTVIAADMDGDGDLDIISASAADDKIAWYENVVIGCLTPATSNAGTNQSICEGATVSVTGTITNAPSSTWSTNGDGTFGNMALPVTTYTPGTADISGGTVTLTLTANDPDGAGPCVAVSSTMIVSIGRIATANAGTDQAICSTANVNLNATIGGSANNPMWTSSGTGSFDNNTSLTAIYTPDANDISAGSVDLTLTVNATGVCPQVPDQLIVSISQLIVAGAASIQSNVGVIANVNVIGISTINVGDVITTTIIQNPTKGVSAPLPNNNVDYTANNGTVGADSFIYRICNQCGDCSDATVTVNIQNAPPAISNPSTPITTVVGQSVVIPFSTLFSDLNDNIDFTSIQVISGPTSNASTSFDSNFDLTIDYATTPFVGTDQLTVEVCDLLGACAQITLQVTVDGSLTAHNGISPNGDGLNDYFKIANIEFISPQNKVSIFTRWGDKVFEIENYDNQNRRFEGKSDSGKELASGVYFYKIVFMNGQPELSGYLTLKR